MDQEKLQKLLNQTAQYDSSSAIAAGAVFDELKDEEFVPDFCSQLPFPTDASAITAAGKADDEMRESGR